MANDRMITRSGARQGRKTRRVAAWLRLKEAGLIPLHQGVMRTGCTKQAKPLGISTKGYGGVVLLVAGLLFGACSSGSSEEATSPTPTTTASQSASEPAPGETPEAATAAGELARLFPRDSQYQFLELPPALQEDVEEQFRKEIPARYRDFLKAVAARSVLEDEEPLEIVVFALLMDPKVNALPGARQEFLNGVAADAVAPPETLRLAGKEAQFSKHRDSQAITFHHSGGIYMVVFGAGPRSRLEAVARTLISSG